MPLQERGKVVLYKSVFVKKNIQASRCVCIKYVSLYNQCQPKVMYGTCYKQTCVLCYYT